MAFRGDVVETLGFLTLESVRRQTPRAGLSRAEQASDLVERSFAGSGIVRGIGEELVALVRPFIVHLRDAGLARKTIRVHLDNTWAICGEIIRDVYENEERRRWTGDRLLLEAVEFGEAPLLYRATQAEQQSCDATARKLRKHLAG